MTKCLIIYFSLGGTTEKAANSIADGLLSSECQVDLCNIKKSEMPESITTPVDWMLFKPFLDYSVQKALRDPEIDNVPIKLNKGQVERI